MKFSNKIKIYDGQNPSFIDRVLAAILVPIAFNFSIFIILSLFLGSSGVRIFNRYKLIYQVPADLVLLTTIFIPAVAGFMMGISKSSTLFGHFFYTNMGDEKDIYKTIGVWVCLLLIAYFITGVLA